ncbi:sister chromatid cohesion protein Dcc1 [Fomitopsis betulina]|nr:sister chromatid cohesion protein Dcc1 [Fomitopsis betulina]
MTEYTLKFSPSTVADTGAFKLLELPPDLSKLIEERPGDFPSFCIKGNSEDDAVLCTANKTYTMRSVVLSNSMVVATVGQADGSIPSVVVVRDQLHEIIELVPSIPRLHKLDTLLRGMEYDERSEDADELYADDPAVSRKYTYEEARETLQASDIELDQGLKRRRVLIVNGELRPISPYYLNTILESLLTHLVSSSLSHASVSVDELCSALEDSYDIRRDISGQVMAWFGDIVAGEWSMDKTAIVREVGLGILRPYKDDTLPLDEFLNKWRQSVGDTFEADVSLDLLTGSYLAQTDDLQDPPITALTYFPTSQLPIDPAARFTDLFLTRARWRAEEITPFLEDIVVDGKERDKLLLKYTRAITDSAGVWYTARAKYNG